MNTPGTPTEPDLISCLTCGVEYGTDVSALPAVCPICADERQYVPASGQQWTTQAELAGRTEVRIAELGSGQWGVTAAGVGIGQTMQVLRTAAGTLLWDPIGLVESAAVEFVRSLGPVLAIVPSHPHMYGAQVAWSRALGGVPVLVNTADDEWVQRRDPALTAWSGEHRIADELTMYTLGGHFPGSAVAHRTSGDGVVLAGDTIMANPDRRTVSFERSYPNRIPLSGAVVARMARTIAPLRFGQLWSNFGNAITSDADAAVQRSAERHVQWVKGTFDALT
ncbi:MBL fold metallo-hydrolase [Pseudonocardia phyllosphaerae]|uniref:hydrolase n=1 Tax=Pseudonocardia phyllosphaerae TaxID=3390502 RepID=UPI00397B9B0E